jgi:hypothetical protein
MAWPFTDSSQYGVAGDDDTAPDLREQPPMQRFSKGFAVPIEKHDISCGIPALYRLDDGRLLARRLDCKTKACGKCGPRLREQWAALWAAVMAGEVVHRLVVGEAEWGRLQRRKIMREAEYGAIPGPDGRRHVYTTAEVGELVADVAAALAGDFAAMPNDRRHRSLSAGWRRRADAIEAFTAPSTSDEGPRAVEFLGFLRAGLEHARQLAREFGIYDQEAGPDGSAFLFHQPADPLSWRRFCRWAGLEHPSRRRRPVRAA